MPCENYREALRETVAADAAPSSQLRLHLNDCASCRAAFDEESQLFAAIDSGLRMAANTEVPASLIPRVKESLKESASPRFSWISAFAVIAASAAIVIALIYVRDARRGDAEHISPASAAVRVVPPRETSSVPLSASSLEKRAPSSKLKAPRAIVSATSIPVQSVAVIVQAGQKQAIDALLLSLRQGQVKGEVLLAEKPDQPLRELEVSP
ncbi:MAG TPA: hypothetical protein VFI75_05885, partial [Candidatus Acidoferrum sp.]|nr:hypothetical protein [Candidatus Acidoferrum sp.]